MIKKLESPKKVMENVKSLIDSLTKKIRMYLNYN